jgi:hypothetical protein
MYAVVDHADASRPGPGTRSVKRSVLGAGVSAAPPPLMAKRGSMGPKAGSTYWIDAETINWLPSRLRFG